MICKVLGMQVALFGAVDAGSNAKAFEQAELSGCGTAAKPEARYYLAHDGRNGNLCVRHKLL